MYLRVENSSSKLIQFLYIAGVMRYFSISIFFFSVLAENPKRKKD